MRCFRSGLRVRRWYCLLSLAPCCGVRVCQVRPAWIFTLRSGVKQARTRAKATADPPPSAEDDNQKATATTIATARATTKGPQTLRKMRLRQRNQLGRRQIATTAMAKTREVTSVEPWRAKKWR